MSIRNGLQAENFADGTFHRVNQVALRDGKIVIIARFEMRVIIAIVCAFVCAGKKFSVVFTQLNPWQLDVAWRSI